APPSPITVNMYEHTQVQSSNASDTVAHNADQFSLLEHEVQGKTDPFSRDFQKTPLQPHQHHPCSEENSTAVLLTNRSKLSRAVSSPCCIFLRITRPEERTAFAMN